LLGFLFYHSNGTVAQNVFALSFPLLFKVRIDKEREKEKGAQ